jgi:hypothetical protein
MLLVRVAHVAQGRSHVKHAARLALGENIVTAEVDLSAFASGA